MAFLQSDDGVLGIVTNGAWPQTTEGIARFEGAALGLVCILSIRCPRAA